MELRIKAHDGNRSKNLRSIADKIDMVLRASESPYEDIRLTLREGHMIRGYMEQLRIIADEIKS